MMAVQTKAVPDLRFSEFDGVWKKSTVAEMSVGKLTNGVFNNPLKVGSGYRIINVKDMYVGDSIDVNSLTLLDLSKKEFERNKVSYGDLFFTRSSIVKEGIAHTNVCLSIDDDITYDGHLIRMKPNQDNALPLFLAYFFTTDYARKQLISRGKTTTMTTIGQEDIASVYIVNPKIDEQQKIADFLTAVDTRIQQLEEKKLLLTKYKKGVMQQIFSQQIRFKDDNGQPYPDWEEKRLGNMCKITTGKLDANAMVEDGQYRFYTCAKEFYRIDKYQFDTEALLISGNGANVGYIHYYKGKFNAYQRTYVLDTFSEDIIFIKYVLEKDLRQRIYSEKNQGNMPYIVLATLSDMKIYLPSDEGEQQKIAAFLTSLDNKIEQVTSQHEQAQAFKKGLLQQMFV